MTQAEARHLAAQIEATPGWHAEVTHNTWTGEYQVRSHAYADIDEAGDWDEYTFHFPVEWARVKQGEAGA